MVPISPTSVAYWTYAGLNGVYYGWQVHKYKREDRRERRELQDELGELEMCITRAQNTIYEDYGWKARWSSLDEIRGCIYSLRNEVEKVPYKGMSLKELALEYREKLEGFEGIKKSLPSLRKALQTVGRNTSPREMAAISAYIQALKEGLHNRYSSVEECLQMFETDFDGTKLAEDSRANRAKHFSDQHGHISADADVVAYVSACTAKVYHNPPDWAPFPKGRYFGRLKPKRPKNKKGRVTMRCSRFGVDRVVFSWDYSKVPTPAQIAAEANKSARWGWFRIACMVGDKFDKDFKNFVKRFASPGMVLYAHELSSGKTFHNYNDISKAFLAYFEPKEKPKQLQEYLIELDRTNQGLDLARFRGVGFDEKDILVLEEDDLLYQVDSERWSVYSV